MNHKYNRLNKFILKLHFTFCSDFTDVFYFTNIRVFTGLIWKSF